MIIPTAVDDLGVFRISVVISAVLSSGTDKSHNIWYLYKWFIPLWKMIPSELGRCELKWNAMVVANLEWLLLILNYACNCQYRVETY